MRTSGAPLLLLLLLAGCAHPPPAGREPAGSSEIIPAADLARLEPRYSVEVLDSGRTLDFRGEVTADSAGELRRALARNPHLATVRLTSPGGDLASAIEAGDAIAARHLETYVPLACVSACTLLFAAGDTRSLGDGARLGFHSAVPAMAAAAGNSMVTAVGNDVMRNWLHGRGVAFGFLDRVLAIPHEDIWYPTPGELRSAGLLRGQAAAAAGKPDLLPLTDWVYLNDPLFVGLQAAYPDDHAALRQALYAAFRAGADDDAMEQLVSDGASAALLKALPHASDGALLAFFQVLRDLMAAQHASDPRLCGAILSPGQLMQGLDPRDERAIGDRMAQALALVLFSVARAPAPAIERAVYEERWAAVGQQIWQSGRLKASDRALLAAPDRDPGRFCSVALIILDALLAAPPQDRAAILRGMVLNY